MGPHGPCSHPLWGAGGGGADARRLLIYWPFDQFTSPNLSPRFESAGNLSEDPSLTMSFFPGRIGMGEGDIQVRRHRRRSRS